MYGRFFLLSVLTCLWVPVQAGPVTWKFENSIYGVTSGDPGSLTGTFRFDADTNNYSHIDITTTPGAKVPGGNFTFLVIYSEPGFAVPNASQFWVANTDNPSQNGASFITFAFDEPLTNLGGVIPLNTVFESPCATPNTCTIEREYVRFESEPEWRVVSVNIPSPATLGLLTAGLVLLRLRARWSWK